MIILPGTTRGVVDGGETVDQIGVAVTRVENGIIAGGAAADRLRIGKRE